VRCLNPLEKGGGGGGGEAPKSSGAFGRCKTQKTKKQQRRIITREEKILGGGRGKPLLFYEKGGARVYTRRKQGHRAGKRKTIFGGRLLFTWGGNEGEGGNGLREEKGTTAPDALSTVKSSFRCEKSPRWGFRGGGGFKGH